MQQYGSFNPSEFDSSYAKGGGVTLNLYMSRTFGWMFLGLMVTFALAWYMAASGLVIRLLMTTPSILMILLVAMRPGETPVPIPNTMVKPQTADGTALETVWESRWPPN